MRQEARSLSPPSQPQLLSPRKIFLSSLTRVDKFVKIPSPQTLFGARSRSVFQHATCLRYSMKNRSLFVNIMINISRLIKWYERAWRQRYSIAKLSPKYRTRKLNARKARNELHRCADIGTGAPWLYRRFEQNDCLDFGVVWECQLGKYLPKRSKFEQRLFVTTTVLHHERNNWKLIAISRLENMVRAETPDKYSSEWCFNTVLSAGRGWLVPSVWCGVIFLGSRRYRKRKASEEYRGHCIN